MKRPGEEPLTNDDFNDASEKTEIAGSTPKPKSVFKRIGNMANEIIKSHNERKHEKQVLATVTEIERLTKSNDLKDKQKLYRLQKNWQELDILDDRILNALLGSYDEFSEDQIKTLIDNGVEEDKILNNEHVKRLATDRFERLLRDDKQAPNGGWHMFGRDSWLSDVWYGDFQHLESIMRAVLEDEDARKQIIEYVGADAISECGDAICGAVIEHEEEVLNHGGDVNKKLVSHALAKLDLLKSLGYQYFTDDSEKKKDRITSLLGNEAKCHALEQLGFMDNDIVSEMYSIKGKLISDFVDGEQSDISKSKLDEKYYIPGRLEPREDDVTAQYWKKQNEECGFDTMTLVASYANHFKRRWLDNGNLDDSFFDDLNSNYEELWYGASSSKAAEHLLGLCYRGEVPSTEDTKLLTFVANNLDKVNNKNMRGFVLNWSKIKCETDEETDAARMAYLKYIAQGSDRFIEPYPNWRKIEFYDEDGNPTERFYDYQRLELYEPKKFLPFIDKNWKEHYTDEELLAMDLREEFPKFYYWNLWPSIPQENFLELLGKNPGAWRSLAAFQKEIGTFGDFEIKEVFNGSVDADSIGDYFDENGPKPEFWQRALASKRFDFLLSQPEEVQQKYGFDAATRQCLMFSKELPSFMFEDSEEEPWMANIPEYFDEKGPKSEFWKKSFKNGDYDVVVNHKDMAIKEGEFDEKQRKILEAYDGIKGEDARAFYRDFMVEHSDDIQLDKIQEIPVLWERLRFSNSEEISKHSDEFIASLLSVNFNSIEELQEAIDRIESVFLRSNLPYVGKVFKTFQILYLGNTRKEKGILKGLPENGIKSKNSVIFNDLLKASLGSNNRDLRHYLANLLEGQKLADQVTNGKADFTQEERGILATYSDHLLALYNNTQAGRKAPASLSGDVLEDIRTLIGLFAPTERYSVPDRIVRSFGFGLGIKTCEEMLEWMDQKVAEADARNRTAAKAGNFKLESGDLVKATKTMYLGNILQNGSVSKEFLNGAEPPDSTPLDTDLNVLPLGLSGDISEGVDKKNEIAAFAAMPCMIVMKGDQNSGKHRFCFEDDGTQYDSTKYEIWHNHGENYGIRVGFPSTEIDFLIHDSRGQLDEYGDLELMKFEVVRNGFYIPIVDKETGKLVFSPEDYDEMRQKMRGLDEYNSGEFCFADEASWGRDERQLVSSLDIPSYELPNGEALPGTAEITQQDEQNKQEVARKRNAILNQVILPIIQEMGLQYEEGLDGDITPGSAEIIDTGSTGRQTNIPGAGDFDYMMRIDREIIIDEAKMKKLRDLFRQKVGDRFLNGNVRAKNVQLDGLDVPIELDVTFTQKTNGVQYSTDMALKDWYRSLEAKSPEKARLVRANIVFAKRFFMAIETYKSSHAEKPQGGLGGVGVENWIMQNGGSFVAAAKDFMRVAEACKTFEEFKAKYSVFDFGENHKNAKHGNFIKDNMDPDGYGRVKTALADFLAKLNTPAESAE